MPTPPQSCTITPVYTIEGVVHHFGGVIVPPINTKLRVNIRKDWRHVMAKLGVWCTGSGVWTMAIWVCNSKPKHLMQHIYTHLALILTQTIVHDNEMVYI